MWWLEHLGLVTQPFHFVDPSADVLLLSAGDAERGQVDDRFTADTNGVITLPVYKLPGNLAAPGNKQPPNHSGHKSL